MKRINMRERVILVLGCLALLIFLNACNEERKETPKTAPKIDSIKPGVVSQAKKHPKYVITVFEQGKSLGDITIETYPEIAPNTCKNFDSLVAIKFYDETAFHRVANKVIIQGGDPNSKDKPQKTWGSGDPNQTKIKAEFNNYMHERGVISAAHRQEDINSANSQFFICLKAMPEYDKQYTIFAKITSGLEIADKVSHADIKAHPLSGELTLPVKKYTMKIRKQE